MKKLIIMLAVAITACTSQVITEKQGNKNSNERDNTPSAVQLNNGSKWKADETTKRNVAAMMRVFGDGNYADVAKKRELLVNMQSRIDTLINQCRMKGADHVALHAWLEKVLKDMKELKEGDDEHNEAPAALEKDIESFYAFFE